MPASDLKGELLLEEDPIGRRAKQSRNYQYALGLLVVGVMSLLLGLYLRFFMDVDSLGDDQLCLLSSFMLLVVGVSFITLLFSLYFYLKGRMLQGVRLYSNGISYPSPLGFRETFYPFAEFRAFEKKDHLAYGYIYVFDQGGGRSLAVKQTTMDLDEFIPLIRSRIQTPTEVTEVDLVSEKKNFRRSEAVWYIIVAALALMMAGVVAVFSVTEIGIYEILVITGLLGPILINTAVFIAAVRFIRQLRTKSWGFGINLRMVASLFGVSVLIFFLAVYGVFYFDTGATDPEVKVMGYPGPSVLNGTFYEGRDLVLAGDITLLPGDNLTIKDCTITFNCSQAKEFGIWTDAGSRLVMMNTTVRPCSETAEFYFELHGSAELSGCSFFSLWSDLRSGHENGDGGLKVHSSDVLVEDCLISQCRGNGMLIDHVSPGVINCTIEHCGDDGIEVLGGAPYIYGNRIQYNNWGIVVMDDCRGTIDSNAFIKNEYGLAVVGSSMVISNNHFIDNTADPFVEQGSDNTVRNNEYVGTEPSVAGQLLDESTGQVCLVLFFLSTMLSFLALYAYNRRMGVPPRGRGKG